MKCFKPYANAGEQDVKSDETRSLLHTDVELENDWQQDRCNAAIGEL